MSSNGRVEEVKVFRHGAEIKRCMTFDAVKGKNVAIFEGLPQNIRPESMNASLVKGGVLMSAEFEVDSFKESVISSELESLKKRFKKVKEQIKEQKSKLDVLRSEERFLNSNRKIGGNTGFTIKDLKEIEKYHIERMEAINAAKAEVELKHEELFEEKERIAREMGSFSNEEVRYAGKITVEFYAESDGEAIINVSYYIDSAWWNPYHEIRMNDISEPVALSMKGSIVQNTGEDWKGVNVKLSTGNPMLGNDQPTLYPWRLDIRAPIMVRHMSLISEAKVAEENMYMDVSAAAPPALPQANEEYTTVEFVMPAPLDIPSSNKPSKVEISRHELDAEVFYYCVSKLDTDAFLIAKIGGWESLNLLAGEVSIFQGNEYVGKTYLDPSANDEDMEISLGRDKSIMVTRERGNNMTSKGMIGKNVKAAREWVITVKNTKSKPIKMKLMDQVPISVNSSITVDVLETSGAEYDKEAGFLTWDIDVPSGETVKKTFKYEVSYPKNSNIHLE